MSDDYDCMDNNNTTTGASKHGDDEKDVHNVFYLLYILLLWSTISMTAWQIEGIKDKFELIKVYCKNDREAMGQSISALEPCKGDAQRADEPRRCLRYHSYAVFLEARIIELEHNIRELSIVTAIAVFLLMSALRSFFGVHFAVGDQEWNDAQKNSFLKRGWNPNYASKVDVVFSGAHVALLGFLAMAAKGDNPKTVAWIIFGQAMLTVVYNAINCFAFFDRLSVRPSSYRFGLILVVDIAIISFSIFFLLAVYGSDDSWISVFWISVLTVLLFLFEVLFTYLPQILQSVWRTILSVFYVVNVKNLWK